MTNHQTANIHIGIIGGLGKMGRWFHRFFSELGYPVSVADRSTRQTPELLAQTCQVVLVAVPLQETVQVVRTVGPLVQKGALLMDIASLKREVVAAMLKFCSGAVIGTHPLFGPGEPNITGQTVVLCPGRGRGWQDWVTGIFVEGGARVEVVSPEEHDYHMALVQGLTHFCTLALGLTIDSLNFDPEKLGRFATPTFHRRLMQISHVFSQDADLYGAMPMLNSAFGEVFQEFEKVFFLLKEVIDKKDIEEFASLFDKARARFCSSSR
ncbi:MAG: prephenate dehydrogenase/arogenate dehydrogenase family protein [Syntrophobacteria bacterium]